MTVADYVKDPQRLAALADSSVLSSRIDGVDRLVRVARTALGVPTVFFTVVTEDRQVFVEQCGLPAHWAEAGATPLSYSYCQAVVRDQSPLIITDSRNDPKFAGHPATSDAGIGAYAGIPVRTVDGHVLGSFCAASPEPRDWSESDLNLLSDLAGAVETHVQLHGARADLHDQLVAVSLDRALENSMMALATATSLSSSVSDIVSAVIEHGQAAVGSVLMSIGVVDHDVIHFVHGEGVSAPIANQWPSAPLDAPVPMAHAVNSGERVILSDSESFSAWPLFADAVADLGIESFAAIPIRAPIADVRAVLGVGWRNPLSRSALPAAVERLAALTMQGIEQAHAYERAREHAAMLESIVLPSDLPIVPGLEASGVYLPPTSGQRVGGDMYDLVPRHDGKVGLVVADAAGHTLAASKGITRVRHAMGVLTLEGRQPADILRTVNEYLSRSAERSYVTACYTLVDIESSTVTIANAGHPRPFLQKDSGEIDAVGVIGEQLLGVSPFEYSEQIVEFAPGDSLLMFTDGLIERRGHPLEEGERWLGDFLRRNADHPPRQIAEEIVAALPSEREDDVALLLVRRSSSPVHGPIEFRWEGRAADVDLADMRKLLSSELGDCGVDRLDDVLLVMTELLTNATEASRDPAHQIRLLASVSGTDLELSVENVGEAFVTTPTMPGAERSRGRGLAIATELADVAVTEKSNGVVVTARFAGVV